MHLWYPNSEEEMRFVEQEILCQLPKEYVRGAGIIEFILWIGVIDKPNGNCLLADEVTKCPVTNYYPGEPSYEYEPCTLYWYGNGTISWNDVRCELSYYGLCEKEL